MIKNEYTPLYFFALENVLGNMYYLDRDIGTNTGVFVSEEVIRIDGLEIGRQNNDTNPPIKIQAWRAHELSDSIRSFDDAAYGITHGARYDISVYAIKEGEVDDMDMMDLYLAKQLSQDIKQERIVKVYKHVG